MKKQNVHVKVESDEVTYPINIVFFFFSFFFTAQNIGMSRSNFQEKSEPG